MPKTALGEVFGFPTNSISPQAEYIRTNRLCPFNNKGPKCTKDSVIDPLGVCSILDGEEMVITCPIRFRQDWLIAVKAAEFFFPGSSTWSALTEVRLPDKNGQPAGNLDMVIVSQDADGRIIDFGAVEVQAVYISGNVRIPFRQYMANPDDYLQANRATRNYMRPDYLSSSRKRLAPQLIYKGGILKKWNKRLAVILQNSFFQTLPPLPTVEREDADIAWMLYDVRPRDDETRFQLTHLETRYTEFKAALDRIITAEAGSLEQFVSYL
jgi:hypothetical protein